MAPQQPSMPKFSFCQRFLSQRGSEVGTFVRLKSCSRGGCPHPFRGWCKGRVGILAPLRLLQSGRVLIHPEFHLLPQSHTLSPIRTPQRAQYRAHHTHVQHNGAAQTPPREDEARISSSA